MKIAVASNALLLVNLIFTCYELNSLLATYRMAILNVLTLSTEENGIFEF